jgi:type II secretory pathway pseudopilin PulG
MNKRFAFSLVELTVVLLIVGLILGIALKGQTLIDSARLRSEVRKIEKLQSTLANYVNRQNKLPPVVAGTISYDLDALINDGYIPKNDTLVGIKATGAGDDYTWKYLACLNTKEGVNDDYSWGLPTLPAQNLLLANICIATANKAVTFLEMDGLLNCTIEVTIDDKNYFGGNGRLKAGKTPPAGLDFNKCDNVSGVSVEYLYKIW